MFKFKLLMYVFCCGVVPALGDVAKFSTVVYDESTLEPIKDVLVVASFRDDIGWRAWTESGKTTLVEKFSDAVGRCSFQGKTNCGRVGYWVKAAPNGYYRGSGDKVPFVDQSLLGIWQPENAVVTIALQRVEHPIPLMVRRERLAISQKSFESFDGTKTELRYDLMRGDWLPPEGKGECADIIIRSSVQMTGTHQEKGLPCRLFFYNLVNAVEFPGAGNGLISKTPPMTSGIKLRMAPQEGYVQSQIIKMGARKKNVGVGTYKTNYTESDPKRCYYFRIRSRYDSTGDLVDGFYGKVYGDFIFEGGWKYGIQGVEFLYYLNPKSLDHNLEWDRTVNLCSRPGRIIEKQP